MSNTFTLHNRAESAGNEAFGDLLTNLGFVRSTPTSGEYLVKKLRLDASKNVLITYDETPES